MSVEESGTAVVIATYNEADNIGPLLDQLMELSPGLTAIIVDDNSPDGTSRIVQRYSDRFTNRVRLIRREAKLGYGSALVTGLGEALRSGSPCIVSMDADFSHEPRAIPSLLEALSNCDVAIGSRYAGGIRVLNWSPWRLFLSLTANRYVKTLLGLHIEDCTSGFRAYRREALQEIDLGSVRASGYAVLVELLAATLRKGSRVQEVPIVFEDRQFGKSKMSRRVILEAAVRPWSLRLGRLFHSGRGTTSGGDPAE